MRSFVVALAVAALFDAAQGVALSDRTVNLDSRDEFRERTRHVFDAKHSHKKFEESKKTLVSEALTRTASMHYDESTEKFTVSEGPIDEQRHSLAHAAFVDVAPETGWGRLSIVGSQEDGHSIDEQRRVFYAVGYLEGYLTCDYIATFYKNYYENTFGASPPGDDLISFIDSNDRWIRNNIAMHAGEDPYWRHIGAVLEQFDGLVAGYNDRCGKSRGAMTPLEFKFMNMNGDLFDIKAKFPSKKDQERANEAEAADVFVPTHCSALIKVLPDFADVFVAHATWDTYTNIFPRIYKHVSVPIARWAPEFNEVEVVQHHVHYSGMPGYLASVDDFYVTKGTSDLSVMETSITIYNKELLKDIVPESVLCWMRAMLSNALARDGAEWTNLFTRHNSGSYNNEWMVTDFRRFRVGRRPEAGFFHVLNQLPGHVVTKDFTDRIVKDLFYGSYNIPVHGTVWEKAGYARKAAKSADPAQFSYDECPRALQFRRLHAHVATDADMSWIIGWNDIPSTASEEDRVRADAYDDVYDEDYPFTPANAIAARCDLVSPTNRKNGESRKAYGAIDGKVTSFTAHMPDIPMQWARAGPTFDEQPVFCWEADLANTTVHEAHPECYDWEWQPMRAHDIFYRA